MFFCEFYEISKNTFSYKTHPMAASTDNTLTLLVLLLRHFIDQNLSDDQVLKFD